MHALVAGGADILELGVPFSDPMADGPVIQRACERALQAGVGMRDVFGWCASSARPTQTTPVVLMGYANPIERMGAAASSPRRKAAGVDGAIVVDYPPEECEEFAAADARRTASTRSSCWRRPRPTERIAQVAQRRQRLHAITSRCKGVTGAGNIDTADVARRIAADPRARQAADRRRLRHPRRRHRASAVAQVADAVVIGSRIIQEMENAPRGKRCRRRRHSWPASARRWTQ